MAHPDLPAPVDPPSPAHEEDALCLPVVHVPPSGNKPPERDAPATVAAPVAAGLLTRPKTTWELRCEVAEAQRDELLAALKEVITNGEGFYGTITDWRISGDVYAMAEEAVSKAEGRLNGRRRELRRADTKPADPRLPSLSSSSLGPALEALIEKWRARRSHLHRAGWAATELCADELDAILRASSLQETSARTTDD